MSSMYKRYCPNCKSDQRGDKIPERDRDLFAGDYFYRTIGIYDMDRDATVEWECPDCKHRWPRK